YKAYVNIWSSKNRRKAQRYRIFRSKGPDRLNTLLPTRKSLNARSSIRRSISTRDLHRLARFRLIVFRSTSGGKSANRNGHSIRILTPIIFLLLVLSNVGLA